MASWFSTALATSAVLGTVAAVVTLAGCSNTPPLPSLGVVPDFKLTDQTGATFDSSTALAKKIWVADFIFTNCPGPCPRMSSQMHEVQDALDSGVSGAGDAVRFVSFTVDPARDTPPVLAAYAHHFEADPKRWFFLTGAETDLNRMSRGVFMLGDVNGSLEHSTRFALIDRSSRIRGYYLTSEPDAVSHLIADAQRLLKENL
jgi:protein SCO1/2